MLLLRLPGWDPPRRTEDSDQPPNLSDKLRLADVAVKGLAVLQKLGMCACPMFCQTALSRMPCLARPRWPPSAANRAPETEEKCMQVGVVFRPLFVESSSGGWLGLFQAIVSWPSSEGKQSGHRRHTDASWRIARRMSCTLHMENARWNHQAGPLTWSSQSLEACMKERQESSTSLGRGRF